MSLNLSQVGYSSKFSPTGDAFAQNDLYKALKALGWASLDKVHPLDRVSLFQLDAATIRRDRNAAPGAWVIEVDGQDHPFTGDAAEATAEAQRLQEPQPKPLSSAAEIAQFLTGEFPELATRIAAALELVEAGKLDLAKYQTEWDNAGFYGCWSCSCPDAHYHSPRTRYGISCKHSLGGLIQQWVSQEKRLTAYRRLEDKLDADRARRLATQGSYDAALKPDRINRKAAHYAQHNGIGHR